MELYGEETAASVMNWHADGKRNLSAKRSAKRHGGGRRRKKGKQAKKKKKAAKKEVIEVLSEDNTGASCNRGGTLPFRGEWVDVFLFDLKVDLEENSFPWSK